MRSKVLALAFALLALSGVTSAQNDSSRPHVVALADGGFVAFKSEAAGTGKTIGVVPALNGGFRSDALVDEDQVIHRVLLDPAGKYIFGYDLVIQALAASKKFNITVKPLDAKIERKLLGNGIDVQPARIPTLRESGKPQVMDDGDSFALDLLVNQNTGVKIIDFVKVSFERSNLWDSNPKTPPRDFTLDAIALRLVDFRLMIDGNIVAAGKRGTDFSGALIWCYVEGHGRFIFSLVPREGYPFVKTGVINDNKIEFAAKGKRYEWFSSSSILPSGGTWNVWVLHDPKYVPFGPKEVMQKEPGTLEKWNQALKRVEDKVRNGSGPTYAIKEQDQRPKEHKRFKVMVGAADNIENLWPRHL